MLDYILDKLRDVPIIGKIVSILNKNHSVESVQSNIENVWNEAIEIYNSFLRDFDDIIIPIIETHRLDIIQAIRSELLNLPRKLETSKFRLIFERMWLFGIKKIAYKKYYKHEIKGKKNLMIVSYGNQIPAIIPILKLFKPSDSITNILYTSHKLVKRVKRVIEENNLINVVILPFIYTNYGVFKDIYLDLKLFYIDLFEDSNVPLIIKKSFLHIFYKIVHTMYQITMFDSLNDIGLIIVFNGNDPLDKMIVDYAKYVSIPTLYYHHAVITDSVQFDKMEADYIVVSGERDRKIFVEKGTNPDNIYDLGLPLYDNLFKKIISKDNKIDIIFKRLWKYGIRSPHIKHILFVTTWYDDFIRENAFKSVVESTKDLDDYMLIVKLHPNEEIDYYEKLAIKYDCRWKIQIVKDTNLHDLINISDLIIGYGTGALFEAVLMDKPVIDLNYGNLESDLYGFEEADCVISVDTPNNLTSMINELLTNKKLQDVLSDARKQYIKYSVSRFDGQASKRIRDLIIKIVNKRGVIYGR